MRRENTAERVVRHGGNYSHRMTRADEFFAKSRLVGLATHPLQEENIALGSRTLTELPSNWLALRVRAASGSTGRLRYSSKRITFLSPPVVFRLHGLQTTSTHGLGFLRISEQILHGLEAISSGSKRVYQEPAHSTVSNDFPATRKVSGDHGDSGEHEFEEFHGFRSEIIGFRVREGTSPARAPRRVIEPLSATTQRSEIFATWRPGRLCLTVVGRFGGSLQLANQLQSRF